MKGLQADEAGRLWGLPALRVYGFMVSDEDLIAFRNFPHGERESAGEPVLGVAFLPRQQSSKIQKRFLKPEMVVLDLSLFIMPEVIIGRQYLFAFVCIAKAVCRRAAEPQMTIVRSLVWILVRISNMTSSYFSRNNRVKFISHTHLACMLTRSNLVSRLTSNKANIKFS